MSNKNLNFFMNGGPYIMGIVNVTPDSFSDGGAYYSPEKAIEHGLRLIEEGADILDIGGESTRPGAAPVSVEEEIARVRPVIEGLREAAPLISIDTYHAATMKAALAAGAGMINDVTALTGDPESLDVIRSTDVPVCIMHMQGDPLCMQEKPNYNNVVVDILDYFHQKIDEYETAGIAKNRLICDVGLGFGKSLDHNLSLIQGLKRFHDLGTPLLIGASRKSFIDGVCNHKTYPQERLPGSLSTVLYALQQGVHIFRVHDVAETRQAFKVWQAIEKAE